ncbi:MAG: AEC family transporter, partial [Vallitaleaceae bacterium]|nr:AEC family transporter [Vallitaleaceae bacterium]
MLNNFIFSLSSALPIFLVMLVGYTLKRKDIINGDFIRKSNFIVFYIALPIKLFHDVKSTSFQDYFDLKFLVFVTLGSVISALFAWGIALLFLRDRSKIGAFVHSSFRGNFLYIGLSLMENITGGIGTKTPLVIAFVIPLYNIIAITVLSLTNTEQREKVSLWGILKGILKNPLIIAIAIGALASSMQLSLPVILTRTMGYFEAVVTPLALITIGASFSFGRLAKDFKPALLASFLKLILIPFLAVILAVSLGFSNEDILIIYILFGVPSATVSYIMTAAMNGDKELA